VLSAAVFGIGATGPILAGSLIDTTGHYSAALAAAACTAARAILLGSHR
jgi:cyanate permease